LKQLTDDSPVSEKIDPKFPKTFICGWPVAHSRSPIIHNYWLEQLKLPGSYEKMPIEPGNLADLIKRLRANEFVGGNITIPHKEAILPLMDRLEPAAKSIGAVNTVWKNKDQLCGDNTDWIGFLAHLDSSFGQWDNQLAKEKYAIVLGAGGAARAVIYALVQRGFKKILLANRTREKAEKLAFEFGDETLPVSVSEIADHFSQTALVINTTSLGMKGMADFDDHFLKSLAKLTESAIVYDLVYVPLETALLKHARQFGVQTLDGLGMLLHQAVPGFERWYGVKPQVGPELRNLIIADLEAGSQ